MKSFITAILIVLLSFLLVYPTMWMINYLFAPTALIAVFGVAKLSFWRTFFVELLFGLFGYKGSK
jgi:hypothetical protein